MIFSQSPARAAGGFVCRNERRSRKAKWGGNNDKQVFFRSRALSARFSRLFPSRQTNRQLRRLVSLKVGRKKKKKEKLVSEKRTGRYVTLVPSDEGFRVLFHWTKSLELL